MPESLHMPAIAADDEIAPHNVFMQFTSGGRLVRNGTTVTFKSRWNAVEPGNPANARVGAGQYRFFCDAFDRVGVNCPLVVLTQLVGVFIGGALRSFPLVCTDGVTFDVITTDAVGLPTDITDGEIQELHIIILGRRVTQIAGVRMKTFNKANFNYGVPGL